MRNAIRRPDHPKPDLAVELNNMIGADINEVIDVLMDSVGRLQSKENERDIARYKSLRALDARAAELAAERDCHLENFRSIKEAHVVGKQLREFIGKAQSGALNTAGGFLVGDEFNNAVEDVRDKVGVGRQLAQFVPMTTDRLNYPKFAGTSITVTYAAEATAPSTVTASADLVGLTAKKIMANLIASSELMDDSPVFADFVVGSVGYALEKKIDDAFFAGDGTSTYGGIRGISGANSAFVSGAAGLVSAASGHSALSSIDNVDIGTLIGSLPAAFHDNAVFVMHPVVWGQLLVRLAATAGAPLVDANRRKLNGYPVVLAPSMPSATTSLTGAIILAFGDFKRASMLGMRRDTSIRYSPSRYLDTDQIGILGSTRFDVVHHGLGDASNAGAVVALVGG